MFQLCKPTCRKLSLANTKYTQNLFPFFSILKFVNLSFFKHKFFAVNKWSQKSFKIKYIGLLFQLLTHFLPHYLYLFLTNYCPELMESV
jgi:hypothetical protein